MGMMLEELEKPEAKKRQGTRTDISKHRGKLPQGSIGKTRDKAAEAVGMSGRTFEKAAEVVEAAKTGSAGQAGAITERRDFSGFFKVG